MYMEDLDNYLKNSSAFARIINAGNGGGIRGMMKKGYLLMDQVLYQLMPLIKL